MPIKCVLPQPPGLSGGRLVAQSLFGMGWSLASTVAKLERCQRTPMSIPWGDHLDLAKCVALIGEDDLREATTAMGRCLFHLQRDLLLETWSVRTEEPPMTLPCAQICAQPPADQLQ